MNNNSKFKSVPIYRTCLVSEQCQGKRGSQRFRWAQRWWVWSWGQNHDHMVEQHPVFHKPSLSTLGDHLGWEGSSPYTYTYMHAHTHTLISCFNPTTLHPWFSISDWEDGSLKAPCISYNNPLMEKLPRCFFRQNVEWSWETLLDNSENTSPQTFSLIQLPQWLSGKESACNAGDSGKALDLWVRKIPWRRKWQPTPVFLPGKFHDRGAWQATVHGIPESDMTEWLKHNNILKIFFKMFPLHRFIWEDTVQG